MNETIYGAKSIGDKSGAKPFASPDARGRGAARRGAALSVLIALALMSAGCFESKVVTSKVTPPSTATRAKDMNGVFYALPRTVVKADVPVVRTNKQPGALSVFTPCFFPGEDYIVKKENEFAVDAAKIKFDTLFIPDTEEIYMIKTRGGMFETRNLEMTLTESGVLIKATADVTNETIDIVTGTIKTGAGIIAKALPLVPLSGGVDPTLDNEQKRCRALSVAKWVEVLELENRNIINTSASIDENSTIDEAALAAVPQIPEMLRDVRKFKSGYEEAEKIAQQINDFVDRRTTILAEQPSVTAQAPSVNADNIRIVLDEMGKTIKELKETYFFGTKSDLTWNASFRLNPSPTKMSIDLFTLSKESGVCAVHVNQGVRLDPRFTIKKRCPNGAATCKAKEMEKVTCTGQKVWLEMARGEDGEGGAGGGLFAERVRSAQLKQDGNRGFFYRIPGRAIAFIKQQPGEGNNAVEHGRAPLSIAQFGEVVSLPASTGGRKTKYTLDLYESSGGLRNFSMGSEALIKQKNIDDLGTATTTLLEAKGERQKAKEPASELEQLEKQRKILEERKKIRDLERELSGETASDEEATP